MRLFRTCLLFASLLVWLTPAQAEKRVALVIGNGAYQHADKLSNPVIDARSMRETLGGLGFSVTYGEDLDQRALRRLIGRFAGAVDDADVALVYFAGHGATFFGIPYVVPVDADFASLSDMPYELVPVETLIGELRRAKGIRIAVLDACRDNEAEKELKRSASRSLASEHGLGRVSQPEGLIIAYATQYMSTAADGDAIGNSPFTAALLKHIKKPDVSVQDMFIHVAQDVVASTRGRQRPEISISMYDSYMIGGEASGGKTAAAGLPETAATPVDRHPADERTAKVAAIPKKMPSRVSSDEPAAEGKPLADTTPFNSVPQARRAALLVEAPEEKNKVKTFAGSVVWSFTEASQSGDGTGPMVEATIDLPDDNTKAKVTFEKNHDASLPASHTIKIRYIVAPGSYSGGVKQINVPQMRAEASPNGEPLKGVTVQVVPNSFLVGLSPGSAEAENINRLGRLQWVDIPMLLDSGRIAKLTFEKGETGQRLIDEAFRRGESERVSRP